MTTTLPRTVLSTQQMHGPVRPRVSPRKEMSAGRGPHVGLWLGGHQGGRHLRGGRWWAQGSAGAVPVARTHEAALLGCLQVSSLWGLPWPHKSGYLSHSPQPIAFYQDFLIVPARQRLLHGLTFPRPLKSPLCGEGCSVVTLFPAVWDCRNCGHTLI